MFATSFELVGQEPVPRFFFQPDFSRLPCRFCERVLAEIAQVCAVPSETYHERYLNVWRLMKDRDRDIDVIFDELKRSSAMLSLMAMRVRNLLTEDEFLQFSEETRHVINQLTRQPPPDADEDEDEDEVLP